MHSCLENETRYFHTKEKLELSFHGSLTLSGNMQIPVALGSTLCCDWKASRFTFQAPLNTIVELHINASYRLSLYRTRQPGPWLNIEVGPLLFSLCRLT